MPLNPVAGQDLGGLNTSSKSSSGNWVFLLTPDTNPQTVSAPLPPFDHIGFNVSIYDHIGLSNHFVSKFNFSSESNTALFGDGQDVSSTLSNITNSVTNSIMRSSNETVALGMVWQQQPIIKVQWGWLSFPLAVVVCSAILLASMIVASQHYDAPHWKSSPLPFLFHGIRDWSNDEELDLAEGRLEKMYVMEGQSKVKEGSIAQKSERRQVVGRRADQSLPC